MSRTAKLFASGGSQAVRLPADYRFDGKEVFIYRDGERVILSPKPQSWADYLAQRSARHGRLHGGHRRAARARAQVPLMALYMLDTDTCAFIMRGPSEGLSRRLRATPLQEQAISVVTLARHAR